MVVVSYSGREINAKIVYYGPGLSGKTTNLEKIYDSVPESNRGRMVSMKTQTDRTLFFDLLPLDLGELSGMKTRFLLYTVPGQVYYNATRKLVLKGVDALVFVADSAPDKMTENRESLANLEQNLKAYGLDLKSVPWVLQFNKRDLSNATSVAQMNKELNRYGVPHFEAQAASGAGVFETLRGVSKLLLSKISKDVIDRDRGSQSAPPRVPTEEPSPRPAAVEEAPTVVAEPPAGRGKLMQFLKRGKTGEAAPAQASPAGQAAEPALTGAEPSRRDPFTPPVSMQPDETVLTREDLIPLTDPGPEPKAASEDFFSADEIEREASYTSRPSEPVTAGNARQITIPVELGSLPPSGHLRVTFEVRIEVDSDTKGSGTRAGMMRDLEVIPD